nr:hypothetical protein [uncultured Campylobacter sp.]
MGFLAHSFIRLLVFSLTSLANASFCFLRACIGDTAKFSAVKTRSRRVKFKAKFTNLAEFDLKFGRKELRRSIARRT